MSSVDRDRADRSGSNAPMPAAPALSPRRAVAADATCLSALGIHVFLDTYATQGIDAALAREAFATGSVEALATRLAETQTDVTIACLGAYAVGFAEVRRGDGGPSPEAQGPEVRRLYVHPRFKRTGIGRTLLARAGHDARAHGAASIWLTAWVGNTAALAFYAALGWRDVGSTPYVIEGVGYENRILVRTLA